MMAGEFGTANGYSMLGRLYAVGYMRGIAESVGVLQTCQSVRFIKTHLDRQSLTLQLLVQTADRRRLGQQQTADVGTNCSVR